MLGSKPRLAGFRVQPIEFHQVHAQRVGDVRHLSLQPIPLQDDLGVLRGLRYAFPVLWIHGTGRYIFRRSARVTRLDEMLSQEPFCSQGK